MGKVSEVNIICGALMGVYYSHQSIRVDLPEELGRGCGEHHLLGKESEEGQDGLIVYVTCSGEM